MRKQSRKGRAKANAWAAVKRQVIRLFGRHCQANIPGCLGEGTDLHHKLPRGRGGKDELGNALWVCRNCHNAIHAHPVYSESRGWLLSGHTEVSQ